MNELFLTTITKPLEVIVNKFSVSFYVSFFLFPCSKVENIIKNSLDLIPLPTPKVKTQIMGGEGCLRNKGKTLLGNVNKLFIFKSLLTTPSKAAAIQMSLFCCDLKKLITVLSNSWNHNKINTWFYD